MEKNDRRKASTREHTEAGIKCRPFTSKGTTQKTNGIMRNFSKEGSYIEISQNFKSGTILHLRTVHYPSSHHDLPGEDKPRSIGLAEIKWKQELREGETPLYGFGLRYLD